MTSPSKVAERYREASFQASNKHLERLKAKGWVVTPEEFAANEHMGSAAEDLAPKLRRFIDDHIVDSVVEPEERQTLENAARILKTLQVPGSLLTVEEKKRPMPPRRPSR